MFHADCFKGQGDKRNGGRRAPAFSDIPGIRCDDRGFKTMILPVPQAVHQGLRVSTHIRPG